MPAESKRSKEAKNKKKRLPYERPAIVYEGVITTRAGSGPASLPPGSEEKLDPADIFGDGG